MKQTILVENVPTFFSANDATGRYWRQQYNNWKNSQVAPLVMTAVREQEIVPVNVYPVEVYVKVLFGKGNQRYDWENNIYMAKVVQDCLMDEGILEDDSCRRIRRGTLDPVRQEKTYNSILYHIVEPN